MITTWYRTACTGSTPASRQTSSTDSRMETPVRESTSRRAASKAKSSIPRRSASERVGTTAERYFTPKPVWRASSRATRVRSCFRSGSSVVLRMSRKE